MSPCALGARAACLRTAEGTGTPIVMRRIPRPMPGGCKFRLWLCVVWMMGVWMGVVL